MWKIMPRWVIWNTYFFFFFILGLIIIILKFDDVHLVTSCQNTEG